MILSLDILLLISAPGSFLNADRQRGAVLFDRKVKFRALKPWEDGYIKDTDFDDGFIHIALVEV